jgi:hypothetical protein
MPLVIVLEPDGEVKLVDLARDDYEQPEMRSVSWGGLVVCTYARMRGLVGGSAAVGLAYGRSAEGAVDRWERAVEAAPGWAGAAPLPAPCSAGAGSVGFEN